MSLPRFEDFFAAATGHPPYDYQSRLAGGDCGADCKSQLIETLKGPCRNAPR